MIRKTTGKLLLNGENLRGNKNKIDCEETKCPIKFLAVLGDFADSAEKSEFLKAKEILDKLEIPYIPVFGNHDVWPYTDFEESETSLGEQYFDEIFWNENATNTKLLIERLGFKRDEVNPRYKNFAFGYNGINFIGLDFVARDPFPGPPKGVGADAVLWDSTLKWFTENLYANNPTIILSHHPLIENRLFAFESDELDKIAETIRKSNADVKANFAGHVHGYYDSNEPWFPSKNPYFMNANTAYTGPSDIPVITTEAIMVASNEPIPKGIIRIVEIKNNEIANYTTIKGDHLLALNPYFKEIELEPEFEGIPFFSKRVWKAEFELYTFTGLSPLSYTLNFDDGSPPKSTDELFYLGFPPYYLPIELKHNYPKEGGMYTLELAAKSITIEENISRTITLPHWYWSIHFLSPGDIVLTDPDGLIISKELSEIPGAFYFETDLDENGDIDDIIILPDDRKVGDYLVTVLPDPNANPTDTYSLGVLAEDDTVLPLAENVEIGNIPSPSYIVRSSETEIIPIIPTTIDFDPGTLNLKSKGKWVTAYIELPIGHGYSVDDINLKSVSFNNQIQAEVKPTEIGDYDNDGIPDLMVKFNRSAVQKILQVGEKIKITIAGNLIDGKLFEGLDFIRVISH